MAVAIDKCTTRVRVRDARRDDVKATTIKDKKIRIKNKNKNKTLIYCIWRSSQTKT